MSELSAAIDFYHSLLDDDTGVLSQAQLTRQLHRRNLFFGERPLCTVLRPRFLTVQHYQLLQQAIREIMPAFARAYHLAMANPDFRAQFMLTEWEEELIHVDPRFKAPSPAARMDCFFTPDDKIYLAEYNAETPAATAYNDALSEVFLSLPVMGVFQRRYEVRPLPGRHHVLHALLDAYRQWGGRERPRIAILDWREVPTYSEFMLFKDYFNGMDFECVIADPRQLEYRGGQLLVDGITPVQLVYKRVLLSELVNREGLDHPVIRAVREHAVCMVNPFRCKLLHKKASFAVLSDEANAHWFSPEELGAVQRYIPWTRHVKERSTIYQGDSIDLLPYLSQNKDCFVLKPNDEYGGKGIVLGWEVSQSEWEDSLKTALLEPSIVQERVAVPREPFPSLHEGRVQIYDRFTDTNPFVWDGAYLSSFLTRLSTADLLNVTAGGGSVVPTFVIEQRR
jgi:hypothetical protein